MPRPRQTGRTARSVMESSLIIAVHVRPGHQGANNKVVLQGDSPQQWIKFLVFDIPMQPLLEGDRHMTTVIGEGGFHRLMDRSLILSIDIIPAINAFRPHGRSWRFGHFQQHLPEVSSLKIALSAE